MGDLAYEGDLPEDFTEPATALSGTSEAPATSAPESTGEEWQGPSREEWEATQQHLAAMAPFVQQFGEFQQELSQLGQQPEYQEYDATDPEQLQEYVNAQIQAGVQEQLAPYTPLLGSIAEHEGERIARESLDQIEGEIGKFDKDQAILLAQVFMQQGYSPEESLVGAAQAVQHYEKQIGEAAVEAYKAQLANSAGAPQTLPSAPGAAVENPPTPTGRDRYEIVADRWLSSQNPGQVG